jgi:SAM-dependent methyltransferase
MALMGADARGIEVEPLLAALYSEPGDTGPLGSGTVHVHSGRWPAEPALVAEIGAGYDLITSKNTLKAGYIHPAREADPRTLVTLGVDDATFLRSIHDALNPGGLFIIYNICPPQNPAEPGPDGKVPPYIPWADGWSPFSREQFDAAGLEVLAFDQRDEAALHPIFAALGYDNGAGVESLKPTTFVWYTVARRRE